MASDLHRDELLTLAKGSRNNTSRFMLQTARDKLRQLWGASGANRSTNASLFIKQPCIFDKTILKKTLMLSCEYTLKIC